MLIITELMRIKLPALIIRPVNEEYLNCDLLFSPISQKTDIKEQII
jgi:hypothetical protein